MDLTLTKEQIDILSSRSKSIKINAFAGCGKTFILKEMAKQVIGGVYLAYNKALLESGKKMFGPNIRCSTIHSYAYREHGFAIKNKLTNKIHKKNIMRIITSPYKNDEETDFYVSLLINSFLLFCNSKEMQMNELIIDMDFFQKNRFETFSVPLNKNKILSDLNTMWRMSTDPQSDFPALHETYLKLMHTKGTKIKEEVIFLDESQDINEVIIGIINAQTHAKKIIVGDKYQSIYSFRGAVNGMDSIPCEKVFSLSTSFRFGQNVGDLASLLLAFAGNTKRVNGIGKTKIAEISSIEEKNLIKEHGSMTIITRTNAEIGRVVTEYAARGFEKIAILSKSTDNVLDTLYIEDLYNTILYSEYVPKNVQLKNILSSDTSSEEESRVVKLKRYASVFNDKNLLTSINNIQSLIKSGCKIHDMIQMIKKAKEFDIKKAEIIITNVHQSKGLEYDLVKVDSFQFGLDSIFTQKNNDIKSIEKIHILYVALTRARKCLMVDRELYKFYSVYAPYMNSKIENIQINDDFIKNKYKNNYFLENLLRLRAQG